MDTRTDQTSDTTPLPHPSFARRTLLAAGGGLAVASVALKGVNAQGTPEASTPEPGAPSGRQAPASATEAGPVIPDELTGAATNWPTAQGNLRATRAAVDSTIDSATLPDIGIAWCYPIDSSGQWGGITSNPIVIDDRIYIQDSACNVRAIDKASGGELWRTDFGEVIGGPNGIGIGYGILVVALGDSHDVAGLEAATGRQLWRSRLSNNFGETVEIAPVIYDSTAYVSTNPTGSGEGQYRGGQKGILYALDVTTGETLWQWDTTTDNLWGQPRTNSGGGVWYPVSIDEAGNLYFGVGNAGPWPGTAEFPNGSSRPQDDLYASSMVSLESTTGVLRWYIQARPRDLFDLDFQNTPVLATVPIDGTDTPVAIGSGKAGLVIAANADTGEELWRVAVGRHQNDDLTEVPAGETVEVYPGTLGGILTPLAYAEGQVFVPILNSPGYYTADGTGEGPGSLATSTGQLVALDAATGDEQWNVDLVTGAIAGAIVANDVVIIGGLDGIVRAYATADGSPVWQYQTGSGHNAPFAISGDYLFVPAGGPLIPSSETPDPAPTPAIELIAFMVGATGIGATPAATPDATPGA